MVQISRMNRSLGWGGWGTSVHHSIDIYSTYITTPTDNLKSPINLSTVGGSRDSRREPSRHMGDMHSPHRKVIFQWGNSDNYRTTLLPFCLLPLLFCLYDPQHNSLKALISNRRQPETFTGPHKNSNNWFGRMRHIWKISWLVCHSFEHFSVIG